MTPSTFKNKNMFNVSNIDWVCEPSVCALMKQHLTSRITWCRDGVPVHPAVAVSKLSGKYMSTRRTPKRIIIQSTAPSAVRIRKSHQPPTSTHPVQSRSPRNTASLGRVRLPHKYTNEVSFAIVSALCMLPVACLRDTHRKLTIFIKSGLCRINQYSTSQTRKDDLPVATRTKNTHYVERSLIEICRLASCNQKTDATWPASPLQCSRSVNILGQKSCVEHLSRAHSQNMSADCWHKLVWLNAIIQPRWHTWKTFQNQSQKPPQHFPTTDNLAKTEFHNLTHNKISETLIRGGKPRNTIAKTWTNKKKSKTAIRLVWKQIWPPHVRR